MIRVLVSGAGKMGRTIVDAVSGETDLEPVGVVDGLGKPGSWSLASGETIPLFDDADFTLNAAEDEDALKLWTSRVDGPAAMEARAQW